MKSTSAENPRGLLERVVDPIRPIVRLVRSIRDRTLHPVRRARARRALRELDEVRSLLILCTGNICRSPYAEKVLSRQPPDGTERPVRAVSAGFLRSGRSSPEEAVRIASGRDVDLSAHRSRTVDLPLVEEADLVLVMETEHRRKLRDLTGRAGPRVLLLGDLDPVPPEQREIQDPWGRSEEVFHSSFDRIDRCLGELARILDGRP